MSGRAKDWQRFEEVSLVLAGLATPLVLSVHTLYRWTLLLCYTGWHTTIFPPYFVAGRFQGLLWLTFLLIIMKSFKLEHITVQHIELMNIVIMITGSISLLLYNDFCSLVFCVEYEQYAFLNRATGPYWWAYWSMMTCNVFFHLSLCGSKLRTSIMFSFI
jgi:molybdopterin-containing oxidoreductase family membrane subunit